MQSYENLWKVAKIWRKLRVPAAPFVFPMQTVPLDAGTEFSGVRHWQRGIYSNQSKSACPFPSANRPG